MLIQNVDIPREFDLINGFIFEESEKDVHTTEFIVEDLIEYLNYLNERYNKRECANRPIWVNEYINLPRDDILW